MRQLFTLDAGNYDEAWETVTRPSVRGIIIRGGRIAMVHSVKYDYYKFPGGGSEAGESQGETLRREVREEAGLTVDPSSVREYGVVRRKERGKGNTIFLQDNFYYLCQTAEEGCAQDLDAYEADEGFALCWMDPRDAIRVNRQPHHGPKSQLMIEREARVLELLIEDGYFGEL